jgi:hypothetical protein
MAGNELPTSCHCCGETTMTWREKRREELLRLSSCDPALLAVRYQETALQNDPLRPPPKISLQAMIEAILDAEEALNHGAGSVRLPQRCDIVGKIPSQQASLTAEPPA